MRYIFSAIAVLLVFYSSFNALKTSSFEGADDFDLPENESGDVLGVNEAFLNAENKTEPDTAFDIGSLGLPDMALPIKITDNELSLDEGAAVILDAGSDKIIFSKDHEKKSPIASITKLATVLVFMDNNPGWEKEYTIKAEDRVEGGTIYLYRGDRVTLENLFKLSLIASDNMAARALMRSSGLGDVLFIKEMNAKMQELGLLDTHFVETAGLSAQNVSTPFETAKLLKAALKVEEIRKALLTEKYEFMTLDGRKKTVYNTNSLLNNHSDPKTILLGGKTGYTEAAGYCFAGMFKNSGGDEIITVFLGGQSINSRFENTKKMADWAFANHEWR